LSKETKCSFLNDSSKNDSSKNYAMLLLNVLRQGLTD